MDLMWINLKANKTSGKKNAKTAEQSAHSTFKH